MSLRPTSSVLCPTFLPGILHCAGLANHRDLDLAGILQLRLDLLGEVAREPEGLVVDQPVGLDDDAQLAPRLDSERLLNTLESVGNVLELLEALDVGLQDLAPGAGSGGRKGVGPVDENRLEGPRLVVAMMA